MWTKAELCNSLHNLLTMTSSVWRISFSLFASNSAFSFLKEYNDNACHWVSETFKDVDVSLLAPAWSEILITPAKEQQILQGIIQVDFISVLAFYQIYSNKTPCTHV